jgi:hypothetical protein
LARATIFVDARHVADFLQHVQDRLVGAAVGRTPERRNARGDTGKGVGPGGAGEAHRGRRSVLLVIRVKQEDAIHGLGEDRGDPARLTGCAEHHVQEVLGVADRLLSGYMKGWPIENL